MEIEERPSAITIYPLNDGIVIGWKFDGWVQLLLTFVIGCPMIGFLIYVVANAMKQHTTIHSLGMIGTILVLLLITGVIWGYLVWEAWTKLATPTSFCSEDGELLIETFMFPVAIPIKEISLICETRPFGSGEVYWITIEYTKERRRHRYRFRRNIFDNFRRFTDALRAMNPQIVLKEID